MLERVGLGVLLRCCPVVILLILVCAAHAQPQEEEASEEETGVETPALPMPPPPPPPPPPASLFQFSFRGAVALTLYGQDTPMASGSGIAALVGPVVKLGDSWQLGGDIRQSRFSLNARGPELLGAVTLASIEMEMTGGNQVTTVPAPPSTVVVRDSMGNPVGTANVPMFTSSPQGDESLLPRLRTAYVELNWDSARNILRAGQYHNLLLAMVSASGAHPAVLGYGAGQLGWRAPGITYSHRFDLSPDVKLDAAVQVNRNSWNDNAPTCGPGMAPPQANCLPNGISLGEAGLPQVEGRLMLLGPPVDTIWPHYVPTKWSAHVVGHWDQKDLSGVNTIAPVGLRDSMTTYVVEAGGKIQFGPLLLAANGWYGQNAGGVFGHVFQMQTPDKGDVTGFGIWGQAGFSLTRYFSVWGFAGVDHPNREQAMAAGFPILQNIQLDFMLAYVNGPLMVTLEWFHVATTALFPIPGATESTTHGNQPSATIAYNF